MGSDGYLELISDIRLDMLEVLGRGYVIDHCIVSFRKRHKELQYRSYITDALQIIAENTAHFAGGRTITNRYIDIVTEKKDKEPQTTQSVVSKIRKKLGG